MTGIKHSFVSEIADGGDISLIRPSDWNAEHVVGTPTIRTSVSNYGASGNAIIVVPATAEVGDILLIFAGSNFAYASITAGWSVLGFSDGGWHNVSAYGKVCVTEDIGATITVSFSGSESWNIVCIVVTDASSLDGFAYNQAQSGQTLTANVTNGVKKNNLCLMFGTARIATSTLTINWGSALVTRNTDAGLSCTVWTGVLADMFAAKATITSPGGTSGIGVALVCFGG